MLEVRGLSVEYHTDDAVVYAVNSVNLSVRSGETIGLVGETGAGKTTIARSILRILPAPAARLTSGEILFGGADVLKLPERDMRKIRGNRIAMIFQDPMTALNPVETVGFQIAEAIKFHDKLTASEAQKRACDMLETVGIPMDRYSEYPHQFSGGMKQRVVIAMALACSPELLLADEPTTALDVTIQAQVLEMIQSLKNRLGTSMILITHDLGVVADICDSVAVAYAGEIVERGTVGDIFDHAAHPYTLGLFGSLPTLNSTENRLNPIKGLMPDPTHLPQGCKFHDRCPIAQPECSATPPPEAEIAPGHFVRCLEYRRHPSFTGGAVAESIRNQAETAAKTPKEPDSRADGEFSKNQAFAEKKTPLLKVQNLKKYFKTGGGMLHAVDDINFTLNAGKTLGVVGESGCGKSTLGRTILHLLDPTDGRIFFDGGDITDPNRAELKKLRENMQIIFQDPFSSLNPRMSVSEAIMEPLKMRGGLSGADMLAETRLLMDTVGLAARLENSYPHELDGGRRQRIGIARAIALKPKFIVCDEPVSALDVSIQAQVINLMLDLQEEFGLAYIFVTHDLSVVKYISDDIMVMYLGQMVEKAPADELFRDTKHPYTKALLSAIPTPSIHNKVERILLKGEITSPINPKPGCRFAARCPHTQAVCSHPQILTECSPGHFVACCKYIDLDGKNE
jgi:peptide/nickel transport system ATP-binding protein